MRSKDQIAIASTSTEGAGTGLKGLVPWQCDWCERWYEWCDWY